QAQRHRLVAEQPRLSRSGRHPDRPAERDLYRWCARTHRDRQLVSQGHAQGLHGRNQRHRERCRRSGPAILREFRVRRGTELYRLLQSGGRQADRPAISGVGCEQAQAAGMADRKAIGRGGRPADYFPSARRNLPATLCEGPDDNGQQHQQRLSHGRHLARQVNPFSPRAGERPVLGENRAVLGRLWGRAEEPMIQAVEGLPDNIVGIIAKGRLTNDDWNRDIKPLIETSLKRHDKIRVYYETGGAFPGAAWGNLRRGIENAPQWEPVAVETAVSWLRDPINALRFHVQAE